MGRAERQQKMEELVSGTQSEATQNYFEIIDATYPALCLTNLMMGVFDAGTNEEQWEQITTYMSWLNELTSREFDSAEEVVDFMKFGTDDETEQIYTPEAVFEGLAQMKALYQPFSQGVIKMGEGGETEFFDCKIEDLAGVGAGASETSKNLIYAFGNIVKMNILFDESTGLPVWSMHLNPAGIKSASGFGEYAKKSTKNVREEFAVQFDQDKEWLKTLPKPTHVVGGTHRFLAGYLVGAHMQLEKEGIQLIRSLNTTGGYNFVLNPDALLQINPYRLRR